MVPLLKLRAFPGLGLENGRNRLIYNDMTKIKLLRSQNRIEVR
jgi:hypothetical protein